MPLSDGSLWPLAAFAAVGVWWWTKQRRRLLRKPKRAEKPVASTAAGVEKRLAALEVRLFDYERQCGEAHATRVAILEAKVAEAEAVADRLEKAVAAAAEFDFTVKLPEPPSPREQSPASPHRDAAARQLKLAGYDDDQIEILLDRGWEERRAA